MKLMTKPLPYQRTGVRKIEEFNGRALLADEMGLGKTFQALLWAVKHPELTPIVIVCPASLKYNWQREAKMHFQLRSEVLEGRKPYSTHGFVKHRNILILNYDILEAWLPFLHYIKPGLIIADECHYLSNPKAKRTKAFRRLAASCPHVIALSGTPLVSKPSELWPVLNILRPDVKIFKNYHPFCVRYCYQAIYRGHIRYRGGKRLKELHDILSNTCMVRRLKQDVIKDLPSKMRTMVPLPLSSIREYDKAVKDFFTWLAMQRLGNSKVKKARRNEEIVKQGYLIRLAAKLKMKAVHEWLDNFLQESDGKIIVFARHRDVIEELHKRYENLSLRMDGSIKGRKRDNAVLQFNKDPKIRMMITNIGEGWDGRAASTVAMVEFGWTPAYHLQREDRTHRIGTKQSVMCYYLFAKGTIEDKLLKIIEKKQSISNTALDGGLAEDTLDVHTQLTKALRS